MPDDQLYFVDSTTAHSERPNKLADGRKVDWVQRGGVVVTLTDGTTHSYAPRFYGSDEKSNSDGTHEYAVLDGALQVQSHQSESFQSNSGVSDTDWESGQHGKVKNRSITRILRTYGPGAWVEATGSTDEPIHRTRAKKSFYEDQQS